MPIVNRGNAQNSLGKCGLDFSAAVALMSDTTNVMKGALSGVQNLIKNDNT